MPNPMKKAVNTIRMKVDGALREIKPGTVFRCPASEVEFLTRAGAITDVKEVTATEVVVDEPTDAKAPEPEPQASEAETEADPHGEPDSEPGDLDQMSESDLRGWANELGVKVTKRMKPETIREKIREHLAEAETADDLL